MVPNVVEIKNGAGFVVFGAKKLMQEEVHHKWGS
jgi:hypothetical protein